MINNISFYSFTDVLEIDLPKKQTSLDVSRGETWRELRKALSPTFTTGQLKVMLEPMDEVTDNLLEHFESLVGKNGKTIAIKEIFEVERQLISYSLL